MTSLSLLLCGSLTLGRLLTRRQGKGRKRRSPAAGGVVSCTAGGLRSPAGLAVVRVSGLGSRVSGPAWACGVTVELTVGQGTWDDWRAQKGTCPLAAAGVLLSLLWGVGAKRPVKQIPALRVSGPQASPLRE